MAPEAGTPSPQVVCNAFVWQYYRILQDAPDQAHKFYNDTSTIGRAGSDGLMECVTTLPEINTKIMSMDFSTYLIKIETADAVLSHNDGVLILVTGLFTMPDDVSQRFTQTFFLAPQESGGYFVLNDILTFISESSKENARNQKDGSVALSDTTAAAVEDRLTPDPVAVENNVAGAELLNVTTVENNPTVNSTTVENNPTINGTIVEIKPTVNEIAVENNVTDDPPVKVTKEDVKKTPIAASSPPPAQKDIPKKHTISASPSPAQKDVTKKTYASIVKDNKEGPPAVKPKIAKPVSKPPAKVVDERAKPLQTAETTPAGTSVTKSNTSHDEQGYSIFVKGLPFNSTAKMVGEEFKKFGAIKPGGIQVRKKFDEFCFGFVEFESQQSMQAAIEASPIFIAEKEIIIQKKLTSTRVVNGIVTNAGGGGRFQYGSSANNFRSQGVGYVNNANYRNGDQFNRRDDGGDQFSRRENGGNHFNRRDDGENHYNRGSDGGNHCNQGNDDDNFNNTRNNFRHRNEFSPPGRGPRQGNGYHQNGNGLHQPRPVQNEKGRYARVNNGPKQTPAAA